MKIKGCIFDLDGTILDSMFVWDKMGANYLIGRGITPQEGVNDTFKCMSMPQAAQFYIDNYGLTDSIEEIVAGIDGRIQDFYVNDVQLKPGVYEFLTKLKEAGIKMCVATATDRHLVEIGLERNNIRHFFSEIFTCTQVGAGKNTPVIYETALKYLALKKEEVMVFEDAAYAVKTATGADFRVACVYDTSFASDWENSSSICEYSITSFEEFNTEVLL